MRHVTRDESRDSGMALVLLLLLVWLAVRQDVLVIAAMAALVVTMAAPRLLAPFAVVWLGLAHMLGIVMSAALFSVVFLVVVTPVGVVRRLLGKDTLQLRRFKAGHDSVMVRRDHLYTAGDLDKPY